MKDNNYKITPLIHLLFHGTEVTADNKGDNNYNCDQFRESVVV